MTSRRTPRPQTRRPLAAKFQQCGLWSNGPRNRRRGRCEFGSNAIGGRLVRWPDCHVDEARPALDAVIVEAEIGAVGRADAVDHPGLEIRDEQLLVDAVIGDVAERGAGILAGR